MLRIVFLVILTVTNQVYCNPDVKITNSTCSRDGIAFYTTISKLGNKLQREERVTFVKQGKYRIQVLLNIRTDRILCLTTPDAYGMAHYYAVRYAIHILEKKHNQSFGVQFDSTCRQIQHTIPRVLEVISQHRSETETDGDSDELYCRPSFLQCNISPDNTALRKRREAPTKILGVVGTFLSLSTITIASLLSVHKIPIISHTASSDKLNQKQELFRSFFRISPPDSRQIEAMVSLFKHMNWTYIQFIGSDDDYGKTAFKDMNELMKEIGEDMCIAAHNYLGTSDTKDLKNVVKKLMLEQDTQKATVVALFIASINDSLKFVTEAAELGFKRYWVVGGGAWDTVGIDSMNKIDVTSRGNLEGMIIINDHEKRRLLPLEKFTEERITKEYMCDKWFRSFMNESFNCDVTDLINDDQIFTCKDGTNTKIKEVLEKISNMGSKRERLIDAIHALGTAINKSCLPTSNDNITLASSEQLSCKGGDIVNSLKKLTFDDTHGEEFKFDEEGNPKHSSFIYELLEIDKKSKKLKIEKYFGAWLWSDKKIHDFNLTGTIWENYINIPQSRCSEVCPEGTFQQRIAKRPCCWRCIECKGKHEYTDTPNMSGYKICPQGRHTEDNKSCRLTKIIWIDLNHLYGKLIFSIGVINFLIGFILVVLFYKYYKLGTLHDHSPHIFRGVCVTVFLNLLYNVLQIFHPTTSLCSIRYTLFFMLFMSFSGIVMLLTVEMFTLIQRFTEKIKFLNGRVKVVQNIIFVGMHLVQFVMIVITLNNKEPAFIKDPINENFKIWIRCSTDVNAIQLLMFFIPFILWMVAFFFAIRESGESHSFHERKLLTFVCFTLALLYLSMGIVFAFLDNHDETILLCFGMQIAHMVFVVCFIAPRVYVGIARSHRGENLFPLKKYNGSSRATSSQNEVRGFCNRKFQNGKVFQNNAEDRSCIQGGNRTAGDTMVVHNANILEDVKLQLELKEHTKTAEQINGYDIQRTPTQMNETWKMHNTINKPQETVDNNKVRSIYEDDEENVNKHGENDSPNNKHISARFFKVSNTMSESLNNINNSYENDDNPDSVESKAAFKRDGDENGKASEINKRFNSTRSKMDWNKKERTIYDSPPNENDTIYC